MRNVARRLAAVERSLRGSLDSDHRRRLEIHHVDSWPACQDAPGMQRCDEHTPGCGVYVGFGPNHAGPVAIKLGGPWLGV